MLANLISRQSKTPTMTLACIRLREQENVEVYWCERMVFGSLEDSREHDFQGRQSRVRVDVIDEDLHVCESEKTSGGF